MVPMDVFKTAYRGRAALQGAAAVVLFLMLSGCSLTGERISGGVAHLAIAAQDGRILIGSKEVPLNKLPERLRRMGAKPTTEIQITVSDDVSPAVLSALTGKLRSAGYAKVIFVKPRKAESSRGD